jgi:glutathione peroxidase
MSAPVTEKSMPEAFVRNRTIPSPPSAKGIETLSSAKTIDEEGPPMSVYAYSARIITGEEKSLSDYEGRVLLIVNTASRCGFTSQYRELQQLYETYRERGLEILAFPCNQFANQEPGTEEEIQRFCETNYRVTFPLFSKVNVKGPDTHPLFKYLTETSPGVLGKEIKWNFTKFLVNRNGEAVKRYAPQTSPRRIVKDIEALLEKP